MSGTPNIEDVLQSGPKMDQCRKRSFSMAVARTEQNSIPPDHSNSRAELWNQHFNYGSIAKNEIRLVRLKQGVANSQIECSLSSTRLPSSDSYHALSYCWGEQRQQKTILVNSQHFKVTEELHAALVCLRETTMDLIIWVDFLCINQSNSKEKEHQVDLMHEIYRQAESVISWLGEDTNDCINQRNEYNGENCPLPYINVDPASCLQNLFSRKYWSRAWIVQEMKFSRPGRLRLRCGMGEKSYENVLEAAGTLCRVMRFDMPDTAQTLFSPVEIPLRLSIFLPSNGRNETFSFREFLDIFLDCDCSDPRDNLFAFKHLFENRLQRKITINYKEDKEVVIPGIFRALMEETQDLYVLTIRARQVCPETDWQKRLPSWCPFVGTPYKTTSLPKLQNQIPRVSPSREKISFEDREGRLVLKVRGTVLGRVLKVQHSCLPGSFQKFKEYSDVRSASRQLLTYRKFLRSFHFKHFPPMPYQPRDTSSSVFAVIDGHSKFSPKEISELEVLARRVTGRSICVFEREKRTKWDKVRKLNSLLQRRKRFDWITRAKGKKKPYWNFASACVTDDAQEGDLICLLSGKQQTPVLLRREGKVYRVVGDISGRFTDHAPGHKKREFLIC